MYYVYADEPEDIKSSVFVTCYFRHTSVLFLVYLPSCVNIAPNRVLLNCVSSTASSLYETRYSVSFNRHCNSIE